jgi:hypothetical protein
VTEVTYLGVVYGTMAALRRMLPRNHGTIVQVGSSLAYRGIPLQASYCGAKHAIQGFTESVRCELIHDGSEVRVTMVQLPAVNTPQFEVVKTTLPNHPQPIPPVFQPEVAARAVVWAAMHPRRELRVGAGTVAGVTLNALFPTPLDHYLAKTGYDSQQTAERLEPARLSNLYESTGADRGAHGKFDDGAHGRSLHLWLTTHRRWVVSALLAGGAVAAAHRLSRTSAARVPEAG